jgi:hypothetical protein
VLWDIERDRQSRGEHGMQAAPRPLFQHAEHRTGCGHQTSTMTLARHKSYWRALRPS